MGCVLTLSTHNEGQMESERVEGSAESIYTDESSERPMHMKPDKRIAIVIPCYNEETQILKVLSSAPARANHLIVIDDRSGDQTSAVTIEAAKKDSRIVLIRHEENKGVGGAIASGYEWCRDNGVDVAVVMAGDGQMDPADFDPLVAPVLDGRVDYAKGNRLLYPNGFKDIPKVRFFGNFVLSFLTKIATGYWHVFDSQTGYTAIGRKPLETLNWSKMYRRYGQPNDLLARLNVYNFRVVDIPVKPVYGVGEVSKLKVRKVLFSISWLLLKVFFFRLREKYILRDSHPLVLFYFFGFLFTGIAAAFGIHIIDLWMDVGSAPQLSSMAFLFSSAIAFQAIAMAMWMDMDYNRELNPGRL